MFPALVRAFLMVVRSPPEPIIREIVRFSNKTASWWVMFRCFHRNVYGFVRVLAFIVFWYLVFCWFCCCFFHCIGCSCIDVTLFWLSLTLLVRLLTFSLLSFCAVVVVCRRVDTGVRFVLWWCGLLLFLFLGAFGYCCSSVLYVIWVDMLFFWWMVALPLLFSYVVFPI